MVVDQGGVGRAVHTLCSRYVGGDKGDDEGLPPHRRYARGGGGGGGDG
jgi:hypothetical protein